MRPAAGPGPATALVLLALPALGAASPTAPSSSPGAVPPPGSTQLPAGLDPTDVTPGLAGFLATAFVVVLTIFLILNLVSRMRRIRHRGALEEAREREEAERAAAGAGPELEGGGAPAALGGHDVVTGEVQEVRREPADPADRGERDDPDTARPPAT